MDLEGFSPVGTTSPRDSYDARKSLKTTVNKTGNQTASLSASTPARSFGASRAQTSPPPRVGASPFHHNPTERRIKSCVDTPDGVYTLQRHHRLPLKLKTLKTSFSPLHQPPTRCSITKTPLNFEDIIFEGQSEKQTQREPNDNKTKENFLVVYNTKDSLFIDRYLHQHKQLSTINPRPINFPDLNESPNKETNTKKHLIVSSWPHQIHCKRYPSCHLFFNNTSNLSGSNRQRTFFLVVGFTTGEIIVYEPWETEKPSFSTTKVSQAAVTCMKWLPQEEGKKFAAGFSDGSILFFELGFTPSKSIPLATTMISRVKKEAIFSIWQNPNAQANPTVKWQICELPVSDIVFSPSGDHLAIASGDGFLKIVDMTKEFHENKIHPVATASQGVSIQLGRCCVAFQSFFGSVLCVAWSPDGKFLATGGEDDFVSIWSFRKCKLMARGQGHRSWVSSVSFDPWKCENTADAMSYRVGSVGQDGRLLLWDYSSENLLRPRSRSSILFSKTKKRSVNVPMVANLNIPVKSSHDDFSFESLVVYAAGSKEVPQLEPIANHRAHNVPANHIHFTENSIITAANEPCVRVWARPGCYVPNATKTMGPLKSPRKQQLEKEEIQPKPKKQETQTLPISQDLEGPNDDKLNTKKTQDIDNTNEKDELQENNQEN